MEGREVEALEFPCGALRGIVVALVPDVQFHGGTEGPTNEKNRGRRPPVNSLPSDPYALGRAIPRDGMVDANDEYVATVRRYYESLDAHDYGTLSSVLDPGFIHYRPDRTFEGRERFVQFMREERPMTDTTHELLGVFTSVDEQSVSSTAQVAVRGRLLDSANDVVFGFVDVHEFSAAGAILATYTYTC